MSREVKRVPVDFDWPLNKVWSGYQLTDEEEERFEEDDCPDCERGDAPRSAYLHDLWYGKVPFRPEDNGSTPFTVDTPEVRAFAERNVNRDADSRRFFVGSMFADDQDAIERAIQREARRLVDLFNGAWSHHLNQDDVDALVEAGRLSDFTHTFTRGEGWKPDPSKPHPTAERVNEWSLQGFGHDAINNWVCVKARCKREGVPSSCQTCGGHGSLERYEGQRAAQEEWKPTEPPTGEGWQLWETVSEGSPISPVFDSAEGLAHWMSSPAYTWGAARPMAYSAALKFVQGPGWAPSFMGDAGGLHNGAEYVGAQAVLEDLES
jgi:hypothetical protein